MSATPDPGQLKRLRRELDKLAERRNVGAWSMGDQIRYDRLCASERALLDAQAAAPH